MDPLYLILLLNVLIIVGGVFVFMSLNKRVSDLHSSDSNTRDSFIIGLNDRVDGLSKTMHETMQKVTESMLKQLNESTKQVDTRLHASSSEIQKTMQTNEQTIRQVTSKLSQMEEANKRIFEVGKDISSLQEILRAPKLRGTMGELLLSQLLSQILPTDQYGLQHGFKNGEIVDAVVKLRDGMLVPIDAKFPLENFKRLIEVTDDTEKLRMRKEFVKDVRKHIDAIATKYIVPDEGTLDFALMYIPAENVYYEIITKGEEYDVISHSYSLRVIPVSPNNLYVYLQTILLGLRGMQIESRAKDILSDLSRLNADFGKVVDSYDTMGKHLNSAVGRYEETGRLINKFGSRVEQIENKTEVVDSQAALIEKEAEQTAQLAFDTDEQSNT